MGHKRKREETNIDPGAWMVTFGDLVTLLLTFFVLLLSMSSMDSQKFKDVVNQSSGRYLTLVEPDDSYGSSPFELEKIKIFKRLEQLLESKSTGLQAKIHVEKQDEKTPLKNRGKGRPADEAGSGPTADDLSTGHGLQDEGEPAAEIKLSSQAGGILVSLPEQITYDAGSAQLKADARDLIGIVVDVAREENLSLTVLGHTDDRPIHSDIYPSNWQLSCARSSSVARFVDGLGALGSDRVRVGGFGDTRPMESNATDEGRKANRRLELWLEPADSWSTAQIASFPALPLFPKNEETEQVPSLFPEEDEKRDQENFGDPAKTFVIF